MNLHPPYLRRSLLVLLAGATLAACGTAPAPVTSLPSPSASPSAQASASPSAAPSEAASAAPGASASALPSASASPSASPIASEGVLPAPLLWMREGQIVRLERDGTTVTPITDETPGQPDILAVIDFDVSPADGSLVYVVQGTNGNVLIRTDAEGQDRNILLDNAQVSMARWSPDGQTLALRMQPTDEQGGVYLMPASGGTPEMLQPDDPRDDANPSTDARGYMPIAWSPDGEQLLLSAYSLSVEMCSAAVIDVQSRELVPIQAPEGMVSGCASGKWSVDGNTIYINMARPGPQPPVPGLWKADPQTGQITQFLQGEFDDGYQLVINPHPLEDGGVLAFVSTVQTLPDPFGGVQVPYNLFRGAQTDGVMVRDDALPIVGQALWADDNSGAVVDMWSADANDVITAWVPVDGGPVAELGRFMGEAKHWAGN
jgi:hypothetical protein